MIEKALEYKNSILILIFLVFLLVILVITKKSKSTKWCKSLVKEDYNHTDKVIVYNSYNRGYTGKPFMKLGKQITQDFCKKNGHVYKEIVHEDDFMSPYWLRVHDLYNMCIGNVDGTIIMYLDADAVVLKDDVNVNQFIESIDPTRKKDIYISEDPNIDNLYYPGIFNTGCFIVRNTPRSRKLVKEWLGKYNNGNKWDLEKNGKWKCTIKKSECSWSNDGYEQGEFSKLYEKNKDIIFRLHWSALACYDTSNKNCYVLHLMGYSDTSREEIFKSLIKDQRRLDF